MRKLATVTAAAALVLGFAAPAQAQIDVVFKIDESGSFGNEIAAVQANVITIFNALPPGSAVGLVGYGTGQHGGGGGQIPHIHTPLTTSLAAFQTAVNSLVATGGTEQGYRAVFESATDTVAAGTLQNSGSLLFTGAPYCNILLTDETPNQGGRTQAQAITAMNNVGGVFFGVVPLGSITAETQPLADATGGALFDLAAFQANAQPVIDAVLAACVAAVGLNHFKLYEVDEASELDPEPVVNLLDQFGPELGVEVEEAEFFGNPVRKERAGEDPVEISNEIAHLTCYGIEDDVDEPKRSVTINNQFGEQTLVVEEAELLCVPTLKISVDGVGQPNQVSLADLGIDHFKLYEVDDAEELGLVVDLFDQFHDELGVEVKKAQFFGNPVDKNGEGIIDEASHLTCYEIEDDGDDEERTLEIDNQFGLQTLEVEEAELLCVPTEKLGVVVIEDDDD